MLPSGRGAIHPRRCRRDAAGPRQRAARGQAPSREGLSDEQGACVMRQVSMQIGAERRPGTATFSSIDPYTGEPWAVLPEATRADVDDRSEEHTSELQSL